MDTAETDTSELDTSDADNVDASQAAIAGAESDFGGLVKGRALGVLRPSSVSELARAVSTARRRGVQLSIRGAGLSQSGQSLPNGGMAIDMSAWKRVWPVDTDRGTVRCESGVTWRELLRQTLPLGWAPVVQPLNLDLTIGGTLSAGGLGSTSHRQGFAASHVVSAEVVLGTGEVVQTGPSEHRAVYDAVFGGVGRAGILATVELALERAPDQVETVVLRYDDPGLLIQDQLVLSGREAAYHVGAICAAGVHGLVKSAEGRREPLRHWSFGLELTARAGEARDELLEGLAFKELLHREVDALEPFLARFDVRFEAMKASGAWQLAHPWFEALVPVAKAPGLLRKMLQLPFFLGDGHRVSVVSDVPRPAAIAFPGAGPAVVLAALPVGIPQQVVPAALRAFATLEAGLYDVGGCRYLSGWLSRTGEFSWQRHYPQQYSRLRALKDELDPANVLGSCLPPL